MDATKVGVRQFRADLAEFIASDTPVAVTKHGQTVGYFIPAQAKSEADIEALKKAGKALDKLLQAKGVDIESMVTEFKAARKKAHSSAKKIKRKAA